MTVVLQTFDMVTSTEGQAIIIIGVLSLLLYAAITLRNPAAIVAWGVTVIFMIMSVMLELGTEWMWLAAISTAMLVLVGAVVRWMA